MFGYSGPMWDLSYLVNLVAPVGSATESEELVPLSEDSESDPFWSPLTASVSLTCKGYYLIPYIYYRSDRPATNKRRVY